jgi:poly(A) polymerase
MVGKAKGLPTEILKESGGKIFTYGSYRLGVYGPGSDIDTLMIAPKHVTRDDFFEHMPDLLRKSTTPDELTELTPVPGISVPIIKLEICGVSVDLIFSNLQVSSVPRGLELTDNNLLRGLDETDLRCVNGTRVTDRILQLVPQSRIFRIALRAVKLWAQRRAIYGNVVGFPGGVAYAMMVARVCQLYPKAAAPLIVQKFFFVMAKWQWPLPVVLQKRETAPLQLREWDPNTSKGDRFHLMPVITPAYPCMNSTHTIGLSTKMVLIRELKRGEEIMTDLYAGKKSWKDLFVRHKFFSEAYKHYICVITAGRTKEAQQAWSGLVQSKLRRLISGIEVSDADSVELVQPFNKGFDRTHECKTDEDIDDTLSGGLKCQVTKTKTTEESADVMVQAAAQGDADAVVEQAENAPAEETKAGTQSIWTTTYYMGIGLKKGMIFHGIRAAWNSADFVLLGAVNLDISWPISDFKRICQEWDGYNADMHSIRVKHVRKWVDLRGSLSTRTNAITATNCPMMFSQKAKPGRRRRKRAKRPPMVQQTALPTTNAVLPLPDWT